MVSYNSGSLKESQVTSLTLNPTSNLEQRGFNWEGQNQRRLSLQTELQSRLGVVDDSLLLYRGSGSDRSSLGERTALTSGLVTLSLEPPSFLRLPNLLANTFFSLFILNLFPPTLLDFLELLLPPEIFL